LCLRSHLLADADIFLKNLLAMYHQSRGLHVAKDRLSLMQQFLNWKFVIMLFSCFPSKFCR